MPTATNGATSLFYEREGDGEPVVFVPEAGLGGWLWGWQHAAVAGPYEAVVWDLRGTGRSDAPPGPYDLETLVADFEGVLTACDARSAHLVATGLGGLLALEAARTTARVETLTLFGTAARGSAIDLEALWAPPDDRAAIRDSLSAGLSETFRTTQPDVCEGIVDWRADGDADRDGWEVQREALADVDLSDRLLEVDQPTRIFHGTDDDIVALEAGRDLARNLPRGEFVTIEDAGHLAFVERSRDVNDRLLAFLEGQTADD